MYVRRLKLRNWKNFKSIDAWLTPRVFLIGPNASGKSNLLDVFRFIRDVSLHGLRAAVEDSARGGVSSLRCLAARKHSDIEIELSLADDSGVVVWEYQLHFNQDSRKRPVIKAERVVDLKSGAEEVVIDRPSTADEADELQKTQTSLEQIVANKGFREVADFFSGISYQHIIPQAVRDPSGFSSLPVQNDPFGRDFVARVWKTPKTTREAWLKRILKVLKVAVPQLTELAVEAEDGEPPQLIVRYTHWRPHPARQTESQLSDGTLRLLGLLWSLFEGDGPLLLEEPELSLHSGLVERLPELFVQVQSEIARMRGGRSKGRRQLVVSTHSSELLSGSGIAAEEVLTLEPSREGTKVTTPSASDREAFLRGLTAADVLLPRAAPADLDQLFLAFSD